MRQYDNVFVPAESKKDVDYYMDKEGDLFGLKEIEGPAFVISEEELWELWCSCAQSQVDHETMKANETLFKTYLQSKGIQL